MSAIIATGTLIFWLYRVRPAAAVIGIRLGRLKAGTIAVVVGAVLILIVPLGIGSTIVVRQQLIVSQATDPANEWAKEQGWQIDDIAYRQGVLRIIALGPPPTIQDEGLRERLDAAGLSDIKVRVTLVIGGSQDVPPSK